MLRKTGEGSYAHVHRLDRPDEPEAATKAGQEVADEALAAAKRLADERGLHLPELAVYAGESLVEKGFELADIEGQLDLDEGLEATEGHSVADSDRPD
jgi:hypothetical protein